MARPANPNKEKIAAIKLDLKTVNKTVRAGETAAKKKESLEAKLAKLSGDAPVAKTVKTQKTSKVEKPAKSSKSEKSAKSSKDKDSTKVKKSKEDKTKLQVVKKRGRPKKIVEDDED